MDEPHAIQTKQKIEEIGNETKKLGCWAKFKSLFDERGFDLEYEYNDRRSINILGENQGDNEGYRRIEDRKSSVKKEREPEKIINIDGDLSGVINFYEQFATLNDESNEDANKWRRSTIRHRVSVRPSILLTHIAEETSTGELEMDDVEEVSNI